jgi:hypothetical protein
MEYLKELCTFLGSLNFKTIVDTLSSLAALIAIITVLIAWYKNARKALSIKQVVIHQTPEQFTYIIKVKNIKPYAVTIKDINCYKQKSFMVEKENNKKPKYSYGYQFNDMAFQSREEFTIQADGLTEISIPTNIKLNDIEQLIIDMGTSHGDQLIICKNIILAPMSATLVLGMEFNEHYSSKYEALCNYYKLKIKYAFGKVFNKS